MTIMERPAVDSVPTTTEPMLSAVAQHFGVRVAALMTVVPNQPPTEAQAVCWFMLYGRAGLGYPAIATMFRCGPDTVATAITQLKQAGWGPAHPVYGQLATAALRPTPPLSLTDIMAEVEAAIQPSTPPFSNHLPLPHVSHTHKSIHPTTQPRPTVITLPKRLPVRPHQTITPPQPVTPAPRPAGMFQARPDYIELPNLTFDQMLALTEAEIKTLFFIVRQTLGYGRDAVTLTYQQIAYGTYGDDGRLLDRGTGLCHKSIGRAVRLLGEKGYLRAQHADRPRRNMAATINNPTTPTGTAAIYRLGQRMRPPRRWID